jgi:preprotein translocase subunit SecA
LQETPKPSLLLGAYPEKPAPEKSFSHSLKRLFAWPHATFGLANIGRYKRFIARVNNVESKLNKLAESDWQNHLQQTRIQLHASGLTDEMTVEVMAVVKVACTKALGLTPYDTQLIAAAIMLEGKLAEMATGEGKTLTAGVCVACAAMAGIPVHLITANDYLVTRDASLLKPLFESLGLTVGAVEHSMEVEQRRAAYASNITYCTAKELVFDYLRDQTALHETPSDMHRRVAQLSGQQAPTLLRGLYMAVIDEADSILIDEARTPLILSRSNLDAVKMQYFEQSITLAKTLHRDADFMINPLAMSVELTDSGRQKLDVKGLGSLWNNEIYREESVSQALAALYLYQRDKHYLISEDEVQIIDEVTGRVSPGRVWSRGLHQMIELKEGCEPSGELVTMTQITYQRFFPRYMRLGGMSGTLSEARGELFSTYNLMIKKVPLRKLSKRNLKPTRLFQTLADQRQAIVNLAKSVHKTDQPILIGTDSVADSEVLSELFNKAGLPHAVLNARQNAEEANIVAQAGQLGKITVSTNMAGRGTDIPLSEEAIQKGGLYVICCQHNISKRIDRQLIGRCARQGDPGTAEMLVTLEKFLVYRNCPAWLTKCIKSTGMTWPAWLVLLSVRFPQWLEEYNQREQRRELLKQDEEAEKNLLSLGIKH